MGTSNSFSGAGPGSPLIPNWLGGSGGAPPAGAPGAAPPGGGPNPPPAGAPPPAVPPAPANRPAPAAPPIPNRFAAARTNLTRFARSGGTDRASLGRAVSNYVSRSTGGAANAAHRMGASRQAGANLFGFLSDVGNRGTAQALAALDLQGLAGLPIQQVFLGLVDYICPDGGTLDEAIARDAFIETIVELADLGVTDLDTLGPDQMKTVFELYATNAIEARLANDIGMNLVQVPLNVDAANNIQAQLHDFIQGGVADALAGVNVVGQALTPDKAMQIVTTVYEAAFHVLEAMGEEAAEQ